MNKLKLSLIAGVLALSGTAAMANDFSANVAVSSDNVFRGISQNNEDPALSGGLDYNHDSGFFIGTWAAQVDIAGLADTELHFYSGYSFDATKGVNITGTVIRYTYPGSDVDLDYNEYLVDVALGDKFTINLGYSDDVFHTDSDGIYYGATYATPLNFAGLNFTASAGHYDLDDGANESYQTYSVGVDRDFGPANVSLSYVGNSSDAEVIFGNDVADNRAVLSISTTF